MRLLLEYHSNPYQENDEGLTPIDVCKHQDILCLLREGGGEEGGAEGGGEGGGAREDSEEEDVFAPPQERQRGRARDSSLKSGSKGSSRSSADSLSLYGEEGEEDEAGRQQEDEDTNSYHHHQEGGGVVVTPDGGVGGAAAARMISRRMDHITTPKSRPRNALYSDLSSSESEGENLDPPGRGRRSAGRYGGVRKVRYHLAKMGEAKQRLLGKLEETGEATEAGHHISAPEKEGVESKGRGKEEEEGEEPVEGVEPKGRGSEPEGEESEDGGLSEGEKFELEEDQEDVTEREGEGPDDGSEEEETEMEVDKKMSDDPLSHGMFECVRPSKNILLHVGSTLFLS